jgi:hypothetical protein
VIKAEAEQPKAEEEKKFEPVVKSKKGPRPKGTKRFKKVVLDEPERPEEELSEHQKKKIENAKRKLEE